MANILLIDDDRDFSALAAAHFSRLGYTVTLSYDGKDGLAKACLIKPEVILLDIMMPGMNGIEVLRELQAADDAAEIPVVIISGKYVDQGMIDLFSQERNFRAFLGKPVALAALQQKVEALLKK
ncbi:MAG TPA: hypothetical protein DEQ38_06545 [Elusimicrobia bacterium]|nr:MAG: hypothetical protein A2089_09010 [Elusimicrobia bacterium GWD2_63_28]HCC47761.1 hypothetical protein [Elusimicrobiota bacterium]